MGRTEPSVGRPPAAFRKDVRSKKAKATINQLIPTLLLTHPRARRGIENAELILHPPRLQPSLKSKEVATSAPRISLKVSDTLTAAHDLLKLDDESSKIDLSNKNARAAILNMASPLSPGGGFLNGAGSQEESLCMRTTLLPSLKDEYYRLPELGAVYTPDVLVFRDESAQDLDKKDRWFVDCVSAAMLRDPELEVNDEGRNYYANDKDRELTLQKMRVVLRICQINGIKRLVLGAWGCGAHGNPVAEIAGAWKRVLLPLKNGKGKQKGEGEMWTGIEDVVFAIQNPGMAEAFMTAFGEGLAYDQKAGPESDDDDDDADPEEIKRRELQTKISELEQRIQTSGNPGVREGLKSILAGLVSQLPKRGSLDEDEASDPDSDHGQSDDGSVE